MAFRICSISGVKFCWLEPASAVARLKCLFYDSTLLAPFCVNLGSKLHSQVKSSVIHHWGLCVDVRLHPLDFPALVELSCARSQPESFHTMCVTSKFLALCCLPLLAKLVLLLRCWSQTTKMQQRHVAQLYSSFSLAVVTILLKIH